MNRKLLIAMATSGAVVVAFILGTYINTFGTTRSLDQADWGTFGDYFGGTLNPIFGLFAFLGILWSLELQMRQTKQLATDKKADSILQVVKDIDTRLAELLKTTIRTDSEHDILIIHMIAEANRLYKLEGDNPVKFLSAADIYIETLSTLKNPNNLISISILEIADQVTTMCNFLKYYPTQQDGGYAPIIEYYIVKISRLIPMLTDAKIIPATTKEFFNSGVERS